MAASSPIVRDARASVSAMLAHPASPRRGGFPPPARPLPESPACAAVVIYESLTGNTARAARLVARRGGGAGRRGDRVPDHRHRPEGAGRGRHRVHRHLGRRAGALRSAPGRVGRIKAMPVIDGKRVAAFATYAINAGKALDRFARVLDGRGPPWSAAPCCGATGSRWASPSSSRVCSTACPRKSPTWGPSGLRARLGVSVRSSTRRTILWTLALVLGLVLVAVAYVRGGDDGGSAVTAPDSPSPQVPDDPGEGCGAAASTDPEDLAVDRTLARCEGAGARTTAARPGTTVRVAITERTETVAPVLVPRPSTSSRPTGSPSTSSTSPAPRRTRGSGRGRRGGRWRA